MSADIPTLFLIVMSPMSRGAVMDSNDIFIVAKLGSGEERY